MKILTMTGYSDPIGDDAEEADLPRIQKPFLPAELGQRIREILDGQETR